VTEQWAVQCLQQGQIFEAQDYLYSIEDSQTQGVRTRGRDRETNSNAEAIYAVGNHVVHLEQVVTESLETITSLFTRPTNLAGRQIRALLRLLFRQQRSLQKADLVNFFISNLRQVMLCQLIQPKPASYPLHLLVFCRVRTPYASVKKAHLSLEETEVLLAGVCV
jgi:hypothetical protein